MIEKDVKNTVKRILKRYAPNHCFMPVQTGFGSPDLDFIITINGFSLRVETKVDGKQPTARQLKTIADLVNSGAVVLIIDQNNTSDFEQVVSLLVRGQQHTAFLFAADSRERYTER